MWAIYNNFLPVDLCPLQHKNTYINSQHSQMSHSIMTSDNEFRISCFKIVCRDGFSDESLIDL